MEGQQRRSVAVHIGFARVLAQAAQGLRTRPARQVVIPRPLRVGPRRLAQVREGRAGDPQRQPGRGGRRRPAALRAGERPVRGEDGHEQQREEQRREVPLLHAVPRRPSHQGEDVERGERRREHGENMREAPAGGAVRAEPRAGGRASRRGENGEQGGPGGDRNARFILDDRPFADDFDDLAQNLRQGVVHRADAPGDEVRGRRAPRHPQAERQQRGDREGGGPPFLLPWRGAALEQQRERYRGDRRDSVVAGQAGERGEARREGQRRPPPAVEKPVRADERQHGEQDERRVRQRLRRRPGQGQRQGGGEAAPRGEEARTQPPPHPRAGGEDRQAEDRRVERAGELARVEAGEAAGGEQERPERRPERQRLAAPVDEPAAREQVLGDRDEDRRIPVQPRPVPARPDEDERSGEGGAGGGERGREAEPAPRRRIRNAHRAALSRARSRPRRRSPPTADRLARARRRRAPHRRR